MRLNLCFFQPTRVHNPNGKSIGSAVFSTVHGTVLSGKLAPAGEYDFNCAHLRHLANSIELVLHSAHPNAQAKRKVDRFSRFRTAYGRYFTMGVPFSQNCTFLWGHLDRRLTRDSHSVVVYNALFTTATCTTDLTVLNVCLRLKCRKVFCIFS